ncbi:MAG: leucyl aminopeptidase [bacterium]|nr:leucyl aminopeptidase [bacterium]
MEYRYACGALVDLATPLLVVFSKEGTNPKKGLFLQLDDLIGGTLQPALTTGDFVGKSGEGMMVYGRGGTKIKRLLMWGLGKDNLTPEIWRKEVARASLYARNAGIRKFAILIDPSSADKLSTNELTEGAVIGSGMALYQFNRYKTQDLDKIKDIEEVTLYVEKAKDRKPLEESGEIAETILDGIVFARDLQNGPPNIVTPTYLMKTCEGIAREYKLNFRAFGKDDLQKMNANGILAVGAGSSEPPYLLVLEYLGGKRGDPPICLIGKGLCIDSGGLSLKSSENMRFMKYDMSGAAVVISVIKTVSALKLPINLISIVPAVENMPDGGAYHVDDVITMMNGKTIEVVNTDAEGRIVLADALHYAISTFKPKGVIDLATLTGAIAIALGRQAAGLFTNNDEFAQKIIEFGERTGERCWKLPMYSEYREQIKSTVADIKNSGGREGGSITAAMFLKEFVDETPWVHLDIAGVAADVKNSPYYQKELGTGFGVRLLVEMFRNWE